MFWPLLNKMALATYSHAMVFGPYSYDGSSDIYLWVKQGLMTFSDFVKTIQTPGYGQYILKVFFS